MNGRCQKDALDRADDICELCGNQYCAHCLLFPRGHRNPPTCKTCALQNSGIRGGSAKNNPISRRDYKKRKKELLEQLENVEDHQPAIEFFELRDPSEFDQSNELDRRTVDIEEEPTIDILAATDDAPPLPASSEPSTPPPPVAAPPVVETPQAPTDEAIDGFAPVDTSVNPLAVGGVPSPRATPAERIPEPAPAVTESEASASAAELLARLKADQPIQSQFTAASASVETDPFAATPTSDLVAPARQAQPLQPAAPADSNPFAQPTPAPAAAGPDSNPFAQPTPAAPAPAPAPDSNPFAQPAPAAVGPAPTPDPFTQPTPATPGARTPTAAPAHGRPKSEPWSPPAPPPRGSNLDAIGGSTSVLEEPEVQDVPIEDPQTPPADSAESADRRKADTDESGQWIPPSLRGMAAEDERDPLPKRR